MSDTETTGGGTDVSVEVQTGGDVPDVSVTDPDTQDDVQPAPEPVDDEPSDDDGA